MLTAEDLEDMEKRARANAPGWQQAVIDLVAERDGLDPRAWMDWKTANGTVLFAQLAQDAQGHAYDGFWRFALGDFWRSANASERKKLLTCVVESLHILISEKNSSGDQALKTRFEEQAVDTVIRYLGVFKDDKVEAAYAALNKKLKNRLGKIARAGKAEDFRRREHASLLALKDAPPAG